MEEGRWYWYPTSNLGFPGQGYRPSQCEVLLHKHLFKLQVRDVKNEVIFENRRMFFKIYLRMLSENIFSLNFCPPNICDPNFCPPNIYDKSTPLYVCMYIAYACTSVMYINYVRMYACMYACIFACKLDWSKIKKCWIYSVLKAALVPYIIWYFMTKFQDIITKFRKVQAFVIGMSFVINHKLLLF